MSDWTLILGGGGFIGSHLARHLLEDGQPVVILDSLARTGAEGMLRRLRAEYGDMLELAIGDLRDRTALRRAVARSARIVNLAARTDTDGALIDPHLDFEVNLRGTVDLLEELRRADRPVPLLHCSTSKVYSALRRLQLIELATRYAPVNDWVAEHGVDEHWPLEVTSPYSCSRAAADQYVLEYARSFGLPAAVARIGCVYGPDGLGGEDQCWISHWLEHALERRSVTIDGDGKQVRDPLHIDDLVAALVGLLDHMDAVHGHAFNVGGGPDSAVSLRELLELMSQVIGHPIPVAWTDWREGDARYYVANPSKLEAMTGWRPVVSLADGLGQLAGWLLAARRTAEATGFATSGTVSA